MISAGSEDKLLGNLLWKPLDSISMNQLSQESGCSYVTTYNAVKEHLEKRQLVRGQKKGKARLISVDLEHADIDSLSSAMLYERKIFLKKNPGIAVFLKDINDKLFNKFYILLLYGSIAKGQQSKTSDIDLLFIIPENQDYEDCLEKINDALKLHKDKKIDYKVITIEDFKSMLEQKYTVGREAFQNSIVLFGVETYYQVVKEYVRKKGY